MTALLNKVLSKGFGQWFYQVFLSFIIYPSIWAAGGLASLGYFVQDILSLSHDWRAIAFIFFATLLPYNLDRLFDSFIQPSPDRNVQTFFRQSHIWLLPLSSAIALGFLIFNAPHQVRFVSCAGIFALMYGLPIFPGRQGHERRWYRLKDIPGLKSWIVSAIVTYALVAIPIAYSGASIYQSVGLVTLFLLTIIGTNAHLFDIRDLETDTENGVLTLPVLIGVRKTRALLICLNLIPIFLISWVWQAEWSTLSPFIAVPIFMLNVSFIWVLQPDTPRNIYTIGLDGCLFVPALLTGVWNLLN